MKIQNVKKLFILLAIISVTVLLACGKKQNEEAVVPAVLQSEAPAVTNPIPTNPTFHSITMEEARKIFDTDDSSYIIVDVRRADEFGEGHIPGAINIDNNSIFDKEPAELPDKDQLLYIYCRSGRRSKEASAKLYEMGYKNIIEFGGILDWTGEIEK